MNGELQASVRTATGKSKVFCSTSDTSREPDREIDSTRLKELLVTQGLPRFWLTQLMLRPDVCWEQHHWVKARAPRRQDRWPERAKGP